MHHVVRPISGSPFITHLPERCMTGNTNHHGCRPRQACDAAVYEWRIVIEDPAA